MKKFLSLMILGSLLQSLLISQSQAFEFSIPKTVEKITEAFDYVVKGPSLEIAATPDEIYETHMDDYLKKVNDYFKARQLITRARWNDLAFGTIAALGVFAITVNSAIRDNGFSPGNINRDYVNLDLDSKNTQYLPYLSSYIIGSSLAVVYGLVKTKLDTDFYYAMNDVNVEQVEKSLQYIRRHADAACQARGAKSAVFGKDEFLALIPVKLSKVKKSANLDGEKLAKEDIVKGEIYLVFDPRYPLMCSMGWFKEAVPLSSLIGKVL